MALCEFYHKLPDEILNTTWPQFKGMINHMVEARRREADHGG